MATAGGSLLAIVTKWMVVTLLVTSVCVSIFQVPDHLAAVNCVEVVRLSVSVWLPKANSPPSLVGPIVHW